ncbi:MAG: hypothetical protein K8T26_13785 [Lentisphaerae bacterium]|nr:hypothetical protein [Lentisphaerota bacterium]
MRTDRGVKVPWAGAIVACGMAGWLLGAAAHAQEPDADLLRGMTNFPQAQGNLPPTPLSSVQEQQVLDAVFSRFPNVDPHVMMTYIRQHFPDELQQYSLRAMENLGEAMTLLMNLVREALDLQALEERRPEAYALVMKQKALEREARALAMATLDGAEADRTARVAQLRETLAASFQAKQDLMRGDIAEIQRQVEDLRALVEEREANREAIISRRVDEIIGRSDATAW